MLVLIGQQDRFSYDYGVREGDALKHDFRDVPEYSKGVDSEIPFDLMRHPRLLSPVRVTVPLLTQTCVDVELSKQQAKRVRAPLFYDLPLIRRSMHG